MFHMVVAVFAIFFYFTCKFLLFFSFRTFTKVSVNNEQVEAEGVGQPVFNTGYVLWHVTPRVILADSIRLYRIFLQFHFFSKLHWTNSTQREFSPSERNARPLSLPRKTFPKPVRFLISLSNAVKSDRSWSNYACIIFHGLCLFPVFLLITIASGIGTKILKICLRHIFGVDHDV